MADKTDEYVLTPCPHCGSTDTYVMVKQSSTPTGWWLPVLFVVIGIAAAVLLNVIGLVILVIAIIAAIISFMMTRKNTTTETWRCNECNQTFAKK